MIAIAPLPTSRVCASDSRAAQLRWAALPVGDRLKCVRQFRYGLAAASHDVANTVARVRGTSMRDALTSEVLPFLAACKFLERNAKRILATRRLSGASSWWLRGVRVEVAREPHGVVLVIAPGNFPLFLAGVQVLQALVAGNAVWWKPAPMSSEVADAVRALLQEAGFPAPLISVLPEERDTVSEALASGAHKVILTGSLDTGLALQKLIAHSERPLPMVAELSGCDLSVLLPSAEIGLAIKTLCFAVTLNSGKTCVAPRTLLIHRSLFDHVTQELISAFTSARAIAVPDTHESDRARSWIKDALMRGARVLGDCDPFSCWPVLLTGVPHEHALRMQGVFAPVLCVETFDRSDEIVDLLRRAEFALGMSVFGSEPEARELAAQVNVGCVTINDIVASTADPRVPFSGRKASGYGVTRGAEGLLEMTQVKAIVTQTSRSPLHLRRERPNDVDVLCALTSLTNAPIRKRWRYLKSMLHSVFTTHEQL